MADHLVHCVLGWNSRIVMPMTLSEYNVGQLYTVAKASGDESNGGQLAIEILANKPFENEWGRGQYTHKVFHIDSKLPKFVAKMVPADAKKLDERAWNAFPYCKTQLTNSFLGERFEITVESVYLANDRGTTENALNLPEEVLKKRQVELLDIAADQVDDPDFSSAFDPRVFCSAQTGRGPLTGNWMMENDPVMCCYKLVTIKFYIFGLETRVQQFIDKTQRNLFLRLNKQVFCSIDEWIGLDVEAIRNLEREVQVVLEEKIKSATASDKHRPTLTEEEAEVVSH